MLCLIVAPSSNGRNRICLKSNGAAREIGGGTGGSRVSAAQLVKTSKRAKTAQRGDKACMVPPPAALPCAFIPRPRRFAYSPFNCKPVPLDDAGLQARRHQGAEFLALRDEALLPVAAQDQRRLHRPPAQPGHDGLDAAPRAGAVMATADIERIGLARGPIEAGVVAAIEEVLQRAAHVAEILGGAEDDGIRPQHGIGARLERRQCAHLDLRDLRPDRKSTRLNSSHGYISYAVFCLKKKR